jgi:lipoic acid synthetase
VPGPLDADEPGRVAEAAAALKLRHVVVTSVTRDDLADGGSAHFVATIAAIRAACEATVEVLTPDFQGREEDILRVVAAGPDVYNHNVETVPRLYPVVRPQARYERSLGLLRVVAAQGGPLAKSGLMVGLGERHEEVLEVMAALREAGCDALTIGQYLRPSVEHLAVERFVPPEEFDAYDAEARALGFRVVVAGPFVRSSYHADALLDGLAVAGTR